MKYIVYGIIILLLSISVLADDDYRELGTSEKDFLLGTGFFNDQLDLSQVTYTTRTLSDGKLTPLVADVDADGTKEIVVADSSAVRLLQYTGSAISQVDTFTIPDEELSNMIIYDIDADGYLEILIALAGSSELIHILEYNGSTFSNITHDYSGLTHATDADVRIQCKAENDCIMIFSTKETGGGGAGTLNTVVFDNETLNAEEIIDTGTWANAKYCHTGIQSIQVVDYDTDGVDEYVLSAYENDASAELAYSIYALSVSSNETTVELTIDNSESSQTVGLSCGEDTYMLTPAYVFDTDTGGNPEIHVGVEETTSGFNIHSFNTAGTKIDQYPFIADGDGTIISNIISGNFVADNDATENEICVLGFNPDNNNTELVCANEGASLETITYDIEDLEVIASGHGAQHRVVTTLVHAVQMSTDTENNENLNEILTTYGVFRLNLDGILCSVGDCDLNLIWDNPKDNGSIISVDYQDEDREDLIMITPTNVWYVDDGFVNSPATITEYTINPCLDSVWKVNTTVSVLTTVTDPDGNNVSSRVTLYSGSPFNRSADWSINTSSGTTFTDYFTANQTIGSGTLLLEGRDVNNIDTVDDIELTFSVASQGVEFGDCSTTVSITAISNETTLASTLGVDVSSNSIQSVVDQWNTYTGLGSTLLWLVVMLVVGLAIFMSDALASIKTPVFIFSEVVLVILGTILGYIPTGVIIILSILILLIMGIFARKIFLDSA